MWRGAVVAVALVLAPLGAAAAAEGASPAVRHDLAPNGHLRAAINYGNPVLASRDARTGELSGISVDLARELGRRLGVPVELVPFDAAGKVSDAAGSGSYDVCFLAVDPVRGEGLLFTAPYVVIEGTYLVPDASPLSHIASVDRDGVRVSVGRGSAYDLYLTRAIKHATLVRVPTSAEAIEAFHRDKLDAAAGVKQPLVAFARAHPGFRVMEGRFMAIEQAMAIPKGKPGENRDAGIGYLRAFVEDVKGSGFVAEATRRHDQPDAAVAPPASSKRD